MGQRSQADRAQSAIDAELSDYYLRGDAAQGLSSSFAPLCGIAIGGAGGAPDPERALVRRHQVGPATETDVTRFRMARASILRVTPESRDVLALYYAPIDWLKVYRLRFSRGSAGGDGDKLYQRTLKRLGPLLGVGLVTARVTKGLASELAKVATRREKAEAKTEPTIIRGERLDAVRYAPAVREEDRWLTPIGWMTAACKSEKAGDRAADDIAEQARALHVTAVFEYIDQSRVVEAEKANGRPWEHWERGAA